MTRALLIALSLAPSISNAQTTVQLQYICKQFVERALDDPRGAELGSWSSGSVTKDKRGFYQVRFPGRARNAYNALRRVNFECLVQYNGNDNFTAISVKAMPLN